MVYAARFAIPDAVCAQLVMFSRVLREALRVEPESSFSHIVPKNVLVLEKLKVQNVIGATRQQKIVYLEDRKYLSLYIL